MSLLTTTANIKIYYRLVCASNRRYDDSLEESEHLFIIRSSDYYLGILTIWGKASEELDAPLKD